MTSSQVQGHPAPALSIVHRALSFALGSYPPHLGTTHRVHITEGEQLKLLPGSRPSPSHHPHREGSEPLLLQWGRPPQLRNHAHSSLHRVTILTRSAGTRSSGTPLPRQCPGHSFAAVFLQHNKEPSTVHVTEDNHPDFISIYKALPHCSLRQSPRPLFSRWWQPPFI